MVKGYCWVVMFVMAVTLVWTDCAFAQDNQDMTERVANLEEQIEELKKQSRIYYDAAEERDAGLGSIINGHISLGGVVEVEAVYTDEESDVELAKVEIVIDAEVNDYVRYLDRRLKSEARN